MPSEHRVFRAGVAISVCYWKRHAEGGSSASNAEDGNFATVTGPGQFPSIEVEASTVGMPSSKWHKLEKLLRLIDIAYDYGGRDKLKELRTFIGVNT